MTGAYQPVSQPAATPEIMPLPWAIRRPLFSGGLAFGLAVVALVVVAYDHGTVNTPGLMAGLALMACAAGLVALALRRALALASALQRSEQRAQAALDALAANRSLMDDAVASVDEGFVLFDADGRLVVVNDRYRRAYPMVADLLVPGTDFATILEAAAHRSGNLDGMGPAGLRQWLDERLTRHLEDKTYAECRLGDGRWYLIGERPTRSGGIVKVITDITAHREAESALRQAQKMDAVGHLAGGIAHEFNNMLTSIGGHARMALRALDDAGRVETCLEEVVKAADRAAGLTRQLLDFSRLMPEDAPAPVDLRVLLRELAGFLRPVLGERVRLDLDFDPASTPSVMAEGQRLHQALVNLCINARDAMPDGGVITIALGTTLPEPAFAARHPGSLPGPMAVIAVSDTGTGIDPAALPHVFEPFFTTKPLGKGTGLGLSMVYATVDGLGGAVEVESAPGAGTTFTLYLPLTESAAAPPSSPSRDRLPSVAETGRSILLVEDEDSVRQYLTMVLEDAGHTVFTAVDGADALMVLEDLADTLDLLVSDVALPHLNGPAIADALHARRAGLPVVFMSGYGDHSGGRVLGQSPGEIFLPKPVDPDTLLDAVDRSLDAAVPPSPARGEA